MSLGEDPVQLDSKIISGKNGPFAVVVDVKTNAPLLVSVKSEDGGWEWKPLTPDLGVREIKGPDSFAGASLGGGDISIPESMDSAIKRQFSANTLEGWHWKYFEPQQGVISNDYQSWDSWMLRRYQGQVLTGHPLYFPENNPDWLQGQSDDALLTILESHIKNIVQSNPRIKRWIVVNEPNEPSVPDIYNQRFGDDVYLRMFQWAHTTNPTATLILNDYNNDHPKNPGNDYGDNTDKIEKILALLKTDPEVYQYVHVGLQMHLYINEPPDLSGLLDTVDQYGVPVDITELTVRLPSIESATSQSEIYKLIGTAVRRAKSIQSITFWGIGNTTQSNGITFYSDNQPDKPSQAYYSFLTGLLGLDDK